MTKAGPIRLRPILMTAVATLMAAIPPALGLGSGSEIRKPMSIAVIGGLVVSTILSLVVVAAFYVVADKWFKKKSGPVKASLATEVPLVEMPSGQSGSAMSITRLPEMSSRQPGGRIT
jgi:hypothetical protein